MKLTVKPIAAIKGAIHLPASKSYSIRAFLIAACGGESFIKHPSNCDDALVACQVAKALGAKVKNNAQGFQIIASDKGKARTHINVKESGTTLRFLLPLISFYYDHMIIKGEKTLIGRPNHHLTQTLRKCGLNIKGAGKKESVPIAYKGGQLTGKTWTIDGSMSSQFISALLIAAAKREEDTQIRISGKKLVSSEYITMTTQILAKSNINVQKSNARLLKVKGGQTFKGLKNFTVPSDWGLAAFFLAAGALLPSHITLKGHLTNELIQSDGEILDFIKRMGVDFQQTSRSIKMKGPFALKGGVFSLKNSPDLVPIMSVLALFASRRVVLKDIAHARVKESDRIGDLRKELLKVGADVIEKKDQLIINPLKEYKNNVTLDAHKDHRLAMAFAILGLKIGVTVKDMDSCKKSYPDFIQDLKQLTA